MSLQEGGIRVFQAASAEALEDIVNQWLHGDHEDGTASGYGRKIIKQAPTFTISGGTFYLVVVYEVG